MGWQGPLSESRKTLLLCSETPEMGGGQGVLVGIGAGRLWEGAMDDSVVSRMRGPLNERGAQHFPES